MNSHIFGASIRSDERMSAIIRSFTTRHYCLETPLTKTNVAHDKNQKNKH